MATGASRPAALALTALFAAACSSGRTDTAIVGFVVDGRTGGPIDFFSSRNLGDSADSINQIYTLMNGELVRATPCGEGILNDSNKAFAASCYKLTGVPYGEQLPIFAVHDGYEKIRGTVVYPSFTMGDGGVKQVIANIRMFPKNFSIDYKLLVTLDGRGVNGVTVACQIRQEDVTLATDGELIVPASTTSPAISAVSATDSIYGDGLVKLGGSSLVLGAKYDCQAFKDDGSVLSGSVSFRAGVDPPEIRLPVEVTRSPDPDLLYAVDSNAEDPTVDLGTNAKLTVHFNRPVEIVATTIDCQTYSMTSTDFMNSGSADPTLPVDTPQNTASEMVRAWMSADNLQLTVEYVAPLSDPPNPNVRHASVTFAGLYVRPKRSNGINGSEVWRVGAPAANSCLAGPYLKETSRALKNRHTGKAQTSTIQLF